MLADGREHDGDERCSKSNKRPQADAKLAGERLRAAACPKVAEQHAPIGFLDQLWPRDHPARPCSQPCLASLPSVLDRLPVSELAWPLALAHGRLRTPEPPHSPPVAIPLPSSQANRALALGPAPLPWPRSLHIPRPRAYHPSPFTTALSSSIRPLPASLAAHCTMLLPRARSLARLPLLKARSYATSSSTHSTLNVPTIGNLDIPTGLFMFVG